jgi:hypothetical protein
MGITLRMLNNLITRVVPLTHTALGPALRITTVGITRTCMIGIVSRSTDAAISAVSPTPVADHRCVDLISECCHSVGLWYHTPDHAIGYAMHSGRSSGGATAFVMALARA